ARAAGTPSERTPPAVHGTRGAAGEYVHPRPRGRKARARVSGVAAARSRRHTACTGPAAAGGAGPSGHAPTSPATVPEPRVTRILVVDDVLAMAEQYAYDLQRLGGWRVRIATSGPEALEALRDEELDCVIL